MATGTSKSVREFVDLILGTQIEGAKELIKGYINGIPEGAWLSFLTQGINSRSAGIILDGILRHCSMKYEQTPAVKEMIKKFSKEFLQKAEENNVPPLYYYQG
jgi:hypothetical protein